MAKHPVSTKKLIVFKEKDLNRIQLLADMYAGGNFSKWIKYAALNCPPKRLVK